MKRLNLELRQATPDDYAITENVVREAFWNYYRPGCNEHYLLHVMRKNPSFLHELDVVAWYEGQIVGSIVYFKSLIKGDDGVDYEVLTLGPIAILPEYQDKGIGGRLITYTKRIARKKGYRAILLYGDPLYYLKHGFIAAEKLGIRTSDDMYAIAHHVCELYDDALRGIRGRYIVDDIYFVDEAATLEFDKNFPPKEMMSGLPSQKRFENLVVMRRKAF